MSAVLLRGGRLIRPGLSKAKQRVQRQGRSQITLSSSIPGDKELVARACNANIEQAQPLLDIIEAGGIRCRALDIPINRTVRKASLQLCQRFRLEVQGAAHEPLFRNVAVIWLA